jgi:hypothetical protein
MSKFYCKITNEAEYHHDYLYKDGLNIFPGKFNNDPWDFCGEGGFYFTDLESIGNYYGYGVWFREIQLPTDNDFQIVIFENKYRADKIILGRKWRLSDINLHQKYNLPVNYVLLKIVCRDGRLDTLKYLVKKSGSLIKDKDLICEAVRNGHIDIIDYLYHHGINIDSEIIDIALKYGKLNVLEWCKSNKINMAYTKSGLGHLKLILMDAANRGDILLFDQLKSYTDYGFKLKCFSEVIEKAVSKGHIHILQWFYESLGDFRYSEKAVELAIENDQLDVLIWLVSHFDMELKLSSKAIILISEAGRTDLLELLMQCKNFHFPFENDNFYYLPDGTKKWWREYNWNNSVYSGTGLLAFSLGMFWMGNLI